jgi:ribonuclease-3
MFNSKRIEVVIEDSEWEDKLQEFQKKINYKFTDINLLKSAFTHNSYFRKQAPYACATSPFERMEFLGDSILGLFVSQELFLSFPDSQEGTLSKMKSKIVSEKYLTVKAKEINLGNYLMLSDDEDRNGGRNRPSILSDAMEALICAIYLDSSLEEAERIIKNVVLLNFRKLIDQDELKNFKSILQEYSQSKYQEPPVYEKVDEIGPDHDKTFIMNVLVNGENVGTGSGPSKKEAQQNAAKEACKLLDL